MAVNLPPQLFFIFCGIRCISIHQPLAFNKPQYLTDGDIGKFTWFQAFSDACLHLSHLQLSTSPAFKRGPFKWHCPVRNLVIIFSWFLLKLSYSPALLRKALSCHCPQIGCRYSSCFLLFQPLITTLATFAVMPRAGSGPISGCEESCLPNWSVISFPSIPMCTGTHTSWMLLCSASCTRDWLQSHANLEFVWKMSRALTLQRGVTGTARIQ